MKGLSYVPPFHKLGALDLVVAVYNVAICDEVDCDPDLTYRQLINIIDRENGKFTKSLLERTLFCLNMNNEDGKFWHPFNRSFDKFLVSALPRGYTFDKYYNLIQKKGN